MSNGYRKTEAQFRKYEDLLLAAVMCPNPLDWIASSPRIKATSLFNDLSFSLLEFIVQRWSSKIDPDIAKVRFVNYKFSVVEPTPENGLDQPSVTWSLRKRALMHGIFEQDHRPKVSQIQATDEMRCAQIATADCRLRLDDMVSYRAVLHCLRVGALKHGVIFYGEPEYDHVTLLRDTGFELVETNDKYGQQCHLLL